MQETRSEPELSELTAVFMVPLRVSLILEEGSFETGIHGMDIIVKS
jgi:hypothetical protein